MTNIKIVIQNVFNVFRLRHAETQNSIHLNTSQVAKYAKKTLEMRSCIDHKECKREERKKHKKKFKQDIRYRLK